MVSPPGPSEREQHPPQPYPPEPPPGPHPSAGHLAAPGSGPRRPPPSWGPPLQPRPVKSRRTRPWIIAGIAAAIVTITAMAAILLFHNLSDDSPKGQLVLPFTGLSDIGGVAVDNSGAVYVTDSTANRVLKLAAGSTTAVELPFTGLDNPHGVAVDSSGTVYLADTGNNRVLKLASGAKSPTELPFTGFNDGNRPTRVAVDSKGAVYCMDSVQLLKLPAGSSKMEYIRNGDAWLSNRAGMAVDRDGAVYLLAVDIIYYGKSETSVLKMDADRSQPSKLEPPISGLEGPAGLAVDSGGMLYIADEDTNRVLKLPSGAKDPIEMPFTGLNKPGDVAVDRAGNVYVVDKGNTRVLKLWKS